MTELPNGTLMPMSGSPAIATNPEWPRLVGRHEEPVPTGAADLEVLDRTRRAVDVGPPLDGGQGPARRACDGVFDEPGARGIARCAGRGDEECLGHVHALFWVGRVIA